MTERSVEIDAIREKHASRVQNTDGDWLCACGAFLVASGDDRLDRSHRQHVDTVVNRSRLASKAGRHPAACYEDGCICDLMGPTAVPRARPEDSTRIPVESGPDGGER